MFRVQTFFDKPGSDCISEVKDLSMAVRMFHNSFRAAGYSGDTGYIELIKTDSGLILGCWSLKLGLWVSDAIVGHFHESDIEGMLDTVATPFESSSQSERKKHGNC